MTTTFPQVDRWLAAVAQAMQPLFDAFSRALDFITRAFSRWARPYALAAQLQFEARELRRAPRAARHAARPPTAGFWKRRCWCAPCRAARFAEVRP